MSTVNISKGTSENYSFLSCEVRNKPKNQVSPLSKLKKLINENPQAFKQFATTVHFCSFKLRRDQKEDYIFKCFSHLKKPHNVFTFL